MEPMACKQRLAFLDGLRGLAVLLMMEQNIGIWLWRSDGPVRFTNHPVLFSLNGIGGLAGPLFITMAGIGSALFVQRHDRIDRTLVLRGLGIMAFGYLMNAITPGLFSTGSWFTLHLIGFAILITPTLRHLPTPYLLLLALAVIIGTGYLHHHWQTPLRLSIHRMRTAPPVRLMIAEGYYTIFPWLAFYLAGLATGRFYLQQRRKAILQTALISLLISSLFLGCRLFQCDIITGEATARFFRLNLGFFPTPPLFVPLFFPVVALLFLCFEWLSQRCRLWDGHFLVCLGRLSMTLQIVHVFLFYEVSQRSGLFRAFTTLETLSILVGFLALSALIAVLWRKGDYRFSSEWALRRIAG